MNADRSAMLEALQAERAGDSAAPVPPPRAYLEALFEALAREIAGHFPHLDLEDDGQALR